MKKFFFVLAIGAFAACNNSSSTEAKTDSPAVAHDSTMKSVDTIKHDSTSVIKDTVKKDTTKK
jgi:hypothetical protein